MTFHKCVIYGVIFCSVLNFQALSYILFHLTLTQASEYIKLFEDEKLRDSKRLIVSMHFILSCPFIYYLKALN